MMKMFEVVLQGKRYYILPLEKGSFKVLSGGTLISEIYPHPGTLVMEWRTVDGDDRTFAESIGSLIIEYHLANAIV